MHWHPVPKEPGYMPAYCYDHAHKKENSLMRRCTRCGTTRIRKELLCYICRKAALRTRGQIGLARGIWITPKGYALLASMRAGQE